MAGLEAPRHTTAISQTPELVAEPVTETVTGAVTDTVYRSPDTGPGSPDVEFDSQSPALIQPGTPLWENAGFWAYLDSFLQVQNSVHTRRAYETDLTEF